MVLEPGGIIAWIVVGLIAGWLTGKVMKGAGYGAFRDIILGLLGGLHRRDRDAPFLHPGPSGLRRQHRGRVHRRGHLGVGGPVSRHLSPDYPDDRLGAGLRRAIRLCAARVWRSWRGRRMHDATAEAGGPGCGSRSTAG